MIFYNAHNIESQLLRTILDIKQIKYHTELVEDQCGILDGDLHIEDLFTAIKYLDERHPKPALFSNNPEQNARLNMFLVKALKAYQTDVNIILKEIEDEIYLPHFMTGEQITIIDLALYPILPNTEDWIDYKQRIANTINK